MSSSSSSVVTLASAALSMDLALTVQTENEAAAAGPGLGLTSPASKRKNYDAFLMLFQFVRTSNVNSDRTRECVRRHPVRTSCHPGRSNTFYSFPPYLQRGLSSETCGILRWW